MPVPHIAHEFTLTLPDSDYIAHLDGFSVIPGGWINHHWVQLGYQLADSVSGLAYSFFGSCIILFLINLIPGCQLRASDEAEILGMDDAEIGEFAYDYVELTRDVIHGEHLADVGSKLSDGRDTPVEEKPFPQNSFAMPQSHSQDTV